ncbi:MAG: MBL fold metallo-hydrolase [Promethearchaeota archaeon]
MVLSKRAKIFICAVLAVVVVGTPLLAISIINAGVINNTVKLTLLGNAGVMIEQGGLRIYIDPIDLPSSYAQLPADAILVTHPHEDHYQSDVIDMLQKPDTVNVFPENMTSAISLHDGVGVLPGSQLQVGHIIIRAFYMYTFSEGVPASHPREAWWTSYIININGFKIFHAGDSKNISEYDQLTGTIDVALLPLGPGCQSMYESEVVDTIQRIQPQYFIPIHFTQDSDAEIFISTYGSQITATGCEIVHITYGDSRLFSIY